ncbi:MAG: site-specific integrase [Deltaproteobacteria bacterium]|nr:site-specific integrase [Deltaproteobacteria bacterium]
MAKKDSINLKTKTARKKLPPYREPYWVKFPPELLKGGSLGFRRSPENNSETWHARVYVDGAYPKKNLGSVRPDFQYKEAFKAALAWAKKIKDAGPVLAKVFTVENVIDSYLLKLQGNSSARFMDKRRQAAKRLQALLPQSMLRKKANSLIDRDVTNVQREYQQRKNKQGEPISPDSVNRVMVHLIAALNHGFKNSMIENNRAWRHYERLPEDIEKRRAKKYIPQKDREAFINACPEPLRAFVSAMNIMAARPSELRRLRVSDVDLMSDDLDMQGARLLTFKGKKGGIRWFPLPKGTPIRKLFSTQIKDKRPDDFVFTAKNGKPWGHANLAKQHNIVRDDGGFSKDFETYAWRHARITDWAKEPFPAPEVARLAGTSLEHIQKNYYEADSNIRSKMAGF